MGPERREQIKAKINWLTYFLSERLWEDDIKERGGFRGFLFRELRILVLVVRSIPRGQIPLRASAMTLATLLALIPMIVLVFTLVGAFGGIKGLETQLQNFIINNLVANVQGSATSYLTKFLEGVHSGAFQGLSFTFLLGAVLGLMGAIENAFNQIWGIKRGRSLPQRLTTYTTIAVLGPFLIGISLTMTASAQNAEIFTRFQDSAQIGGLMHILFGFVPLLVSILGLTLLYIIMPNTRVGFVSALSSGVTAGVILEISKWGYGLYLSSRTMYTTLYGSLTAIPLLFLWVQLSWIIVLFGALLTFSREAADDFILEESAVTASQQNRLRAALRCMIFITTSHSQGLQAPNVSQLSAALHIPVRLVRATMEQLQIGGLLHEVIVSDSKGEGGLVPAKDMQNLSIYDVVNCLQNIGTTSPLNRSTAEGQEVERILGEIDSQLKSLSQPITFGQILEKTKTDRLLAPGADGPVKLVRS